MNKPRKLLELEWAYLSQAAVDRAAQIMTYQGIQDIELAVEMAVAQLGDEVAFVIEEGGVS